MVRPRPDKRESRISRYSILICLLLTVGLASVLIAGAVSGQVATVAIADGPAVTEEDTEPSQEATTVEHSVEQPIIAPGETTEVTLSATIGVEADFIVLSDDITPDAAGVEVTEITRNGETWDRSETELAVQPGAVTLLSSGVFEAGSTVTLTYEFQAPDENETFGLDGSLYVTTPDGNSANDTSTATITVDAADAPQGIGQFADPETGTIETAGLRDAIGAWRSGDIETDLLRDVINAWRTGEVVA